jgi:hypothetical protein
MKKLMVAGVLLAGVFAFTASAEAHGLRKGCGGCESDCAQACAQPCAPAAPQYVDKVVTCYKTEWRERDVECTVNRMVSHEEVRKHNYTVCVPVWSEEKRSVTEYKRVAKEVEREVVVCRKVEAPCGGCDTGCDNGCDNGCGHRHKLLGRRRGGDCGGCATACNVVQEVQKVKCTVYECVPVKRDITVKVCHYEQQQKVSETKCLVWECKAEKVMKKVRYCERVPYQTTVKVCVSCASSCDNGCASGCGRQHSRGGLRHRHGGCDSCGG